MAWIKLKSAKNNLKVQGRYTVTEITLWAQTVSLNLKPILLALTFYSLKKNTHSADNLTYMN